MDKEQTRINALNLFNCNQKGKSNPEHFQNCMECQLKKAKGKGTIPNVAGWHRTFIQAGIKLSERQYKDLMKNLKECDNKAYQESLKEDIEIFGLNY